MIQRRPHPLTVCATAVAVVSALVVGGVPAAIAQEATPADSLAAAMAPTVTTADSSAVAAPDSVRLPALDPDLIGFDRAEPDFWQTRVSPTGAVLMTPVFPGWGQLYARNSWRAGLAYGTQMFFWTNLISRDRRARRARDFGQRFALDDPNRARYDADADELWNQMRDFAWWSGGTLLIIALDAYVGAHLFAFDEDAVPVPDQWQEQFGTPGDEPGGLALAPTYTVFQWRMTF